MFVPRSACIISAVFSSASISARISFICSERSDTVDDMRMSRRPLLLRGEEEDEEEEEEVAD